MKQRSLKKLCSGIAALALFGTAIVHAGVTRNLTCIACGAWNSAGIHISTSNYQIGFSTEFPNEQAPYFEFDLTPIKGKKVTDCGILIPGSTDYNITSYWVKPNNGFSTHTQFKVRVAAQCNPAYPITLSQILTGNNSTITYINATDFNRNTDLGYGWVPDGVHKGAVFDAFHYEKVGTGEGGKKVGPWFQNEVNAGGKWVVWAYSGLDSQKNGTRASENYIWGSTSFNTGIILELTTTN
jgi:hypothetical protein